MQLNYEINGEKYILIQDWVKTELGLREAQQRIKDYDCILQGGETHRDFWNGSSFTLNILVPEKNIIAFNREFISLD